MKYFTHIISPNTTTSLQDYNHPHPAGCKTGAQRGYSEGKTNQSSIPDLPAIETHTLHRKGQRQGTSAWGREDKGIIDLPFKESEGFYVKAEPRSFPEDRGLRPRDGA